MKGIITEIQRFSLHDGPGIRTTVFMKGCNMRCAWCHNPETIQIKPQLQFFPGKCIECGECIRICPNGVHAVLGNKRVLKRDLCVGCGKCASVCYSGALVLVGKEIDTKEVMKEIMEDIQYYHQSGGGITISGGEPLVQKFFSFEILKLCKEKGIHTAIETNVAMPWSDISFILPVTDLIMLDIKAMDDSVHKKWTGVSNSRILKNIKKLSEKEIPLIIRTPIIPGVNDSTEEIGRIAKYISSLSNVLYYELLPFNPLGAPKYESLDMKNVFEHSKITDKKLMKQLAQTARKFVKNVRMKV